MLIIHILALPCLCGRLFTVLQGLSDASYVPLEFSCTDMLIMFMLQQGLCEASYVLLEYARTAMFMWMFIEGLYLHNMITGERHRFTLLLFSRLVCYGLTVGRICGQVLH